GDARYEHDAQGRVVLRQRKRLSRKPDTWRYQWDADDRLIAVTTPDGTRWSYRYDPLGRRIAKLRLTSDGSVAERVDFAWDGSVLAEQTHSAGHATTWEFAPDSFRPLTQTERTRTGQDWVDQRFYAIITDIVGTPTELVDERGIPAWRQ
ncbi:RHS repeat protein, partial [Saccharothrix algeriensis]